LDRLDGVVKLFFINNKTRCEKFPFFPVGNKELLVRFFSHNDHIITIYFGFMQGRQYF
jgi:hypothetical protein